MSNTFDVEHSVVERYSESAKERIAGLCCPVEYNSKYLSVLPEEIRERDYGCGDPSAYLQEGETVLDLGSGGGKICYIASQIVGPSGRVVGIDMNDEMLALAERHRQDVGKRIGYHNVEFRKGRIQDLKLDLTLADRYLAGNPVRTSSDWSRFNAYCEELRQTQPLVADDSVDVAVSNCVLNLVRPEDKEHLLAELFRIIRRGGRAVISDIVSDEPVPQDLQQDPELWSGCISGAYLEDAFLEAFGQAGFHGTHIVRRSGSPWRTIRGIEFRSVTVIAHKGKQGPCWERKQAVIYRGPWRKVIDDDGHVLERGKRMAVCDKTFKLYQSAPYAGDIIPVEPFEHIPLEQAAPFDCKRPNVRHPRETKGLAYSITDLSRTSCCDAGSNCC